MSEERKQSADEPGGAEAQRDGPQEGSAAEIYVHPQDMAAASWPSYPPQPEVYTRAPTASRARHPFTAPGAGSAPGYEREAVAQVQPLPLGQAIRELPGQYQKILFRPGPRSFSQEQGKAEWSIIWIQLLILVIFEAMLALPVGLVDIPVLNSSLSALGAAPLSSSFFLTALTLGIVLFAPIAFFTVVGVQYLLGRAFQGTGHMKQQAYNQLLFQVPTTFLTALLYLAMTPVLGGVAALLAAPPGTALPSNVSPPGLLIVLVVSLLAWAVGIYSVVLNVFAIMATHRVTGGRATGVVLIPYALLLVLYAGCVCAGAFVMMSSL